MSLASFLLDVFPLILYLLIWFICQYFIILGKLPTEWQWYGSILKRPLLHDHRVLLFCKKFPTSQFFYCISCSKWLFVCDHLIEFLTSWEAVSHLGTDIWHQFILLSAFWWYHFSVSGGSWGFDVKSCGNRLNEFGDVLKLISRKNLSLKCFALWLRLMVFKYTFIMLLILLFIKSCAGPWLAAVLWCSTSTKNIPSLSSSSTCALYSLMVKFCTAPGLCALVNIRLAAR